MNFSRRTFLGSLAAAMALRSVRAFAKNVAVMARLAKRGGLKGVITDFEDYWKQKQYRYDAGKDGGTYASACKLARQRGRTCRAGARRSGTSPLMTLGSWRRSVRRTSTARRVSSRMRSTSDPQNASNRRWGWSCCSAEAAD